MPIAPSLNVFLNDAESSHFDYFRLKTAPASNSFVSSTFWSHTVFQTSFDEPAIRHLALSLGAWHRHYDSKGEAQELQYSLKQYDKAMHHAHELLKRADQDKANLGLVLTALVLFHCLQNCIGDYAAAEKSLATARSLATGIPLTSRTDSISDIKFTIHRLEIHSSTFSDESARYEFDDSFSSEEESTPETFHNLEDAANILLVLLKDAFHINDLGYMAIFLDKPSTMSYEDIWALRTTLFGKLKRWTDRANALEERSSMTEVMTMNIALMRVYHTLALIALCKDKSHSELVWDLYQPQLVYILSTVEAIVKTGAAPSSTDPSETHPSETHPVASQQPFSCELGIVAPLFLVASRCRDPLLRRTAVSLLAQCRRHEGRWDSIGAAAVAQRIIEIEEQGLGDVQSCHDIPVSRRISSVLPRVMIAERIVHARFYTPAAPTEEERFKPETIYF